VLTHTGTEAVIVAAVLAVTRLATHAIYDRERWRRFQSLIFLALVVAVVWWLLADGGVHILLHDFSQAGTAARPVAQ
jgi:hypothetical protein